MKTSPYLLAVIATSFFLSSCALPPGDAWRVIRHDGFFTYLAIEFGNRPVPPPLPTALRTASVARQTQPPITVPWRASANRYWNTNPVSPVVGPPKASPTAPPATVSTPKPILRTPRNQPAVVATPATVAPPAVAAASKPELQKQAEPKVAEAPSAPAVTKPSAPSPTPAAPTEAPAPPVLPAPAKVDDLPYGEVIAGRPGFVHSPYALKSQIVDVTGLRPGQEVKCPFTGKLFRVPPGEQAAAKPADEKK